MANLQIIKALAKQKNITLISLARQAGLTEQGLHKAIAKNSTTIETLERISTILEISPREFFPETSTSALRYQSAEADNTSQAETGDYVTQIGCDPKLIETNAKLVDQIQILVTTNAAISNKLISLL